ncbi:putative SAM-dependent methyltransferase [Sorangium cellulosum So ce56]|uniref:SAM-dependent methyltransferase n=1 Tax=Sorangium cellulosum (strain So ce56) TaxID=448385 RepID=A9FN63_SORC5|nr:class I SAM-dependent methyltransferase [Sorangium cellulosum]CAN98395.1 putative SAM-dependent methyltransferase [Sorangium cellulosum So ce56]
MTTLYTATFATFYDRYYTGWVREFAPRLAAYLTETGVVDRSIVDLCCGTGVSAAIFCDAGFQVTGVDLSAGMLALARERLAARIDAGAVRLVEADAADFALPAPAGACVSLDGALNHLDSTAELERCFHAVSAALLEGGQFIFDLFEPAHFRHWHHVTVIDEPDAVIAKRGVWDEGTRRGMLRVSGAFGGGPTCSRVEQTLVSRAFAPQEVTAALASAGLTPVACDLDPTTAGMRPEALRVGGPNRTVYRALKRG